jgi:hypothetical protein
VEASLLLRRFCFELGLVEEDSLLRVDESVVESEADGEDARFLESVYTLSRSALLRATVCLLISAPFVVKVGFVIGAEMYVAKP